MLLAAVIAVDTEHDEVDPTPARRTRPARGRDSPVKRYGPRAAVTALALAAILAVWFPLQGDTSIRESQIEVADGDLRAALADAEDAANAQPYAAGPKIQQAIVLELQGEIPEAVDAARSATHKEASNWRNWITLSRLEARAGNAEGAVRALRRARQLNPRPLGGAA